LDIGYGYWILGIGYWVLASFRSRQDIERFFQGPTDTKVGMYAQIFSSLPHDVLCALPFVDVAPVPPLEVWRGPVTRYTNCADPQVQKIELPRDSETARQRAGPNGAMMRIVLKVLVDRL